MTVFSVWHVTSIWLFGIWPRLFDFVTSLTCVSLRGVDPYGTGGRVPPIFGLGGQYYECPPQYFKSNIGYFSSMLHVLDRCFSLAVDLVSMGRQCCVIRLLWHCRLVQ